MFFAAFSSSRVPICLALLHRQAYTLSSQEECGFLPGLSGTPPPPTTCWLGSMFPALPPRMRWSLKLCGEIIFWCPDVVWALVFSNLWTRSKEQACRVEAYNLPDLLLICFLKPRGQSMLILTLVINPLCPHSLHKSILGHKCDWCYFVFSFFEFFFLHDVTDQIFWFCLFLFF